MGYFYLTLAVIMEAVAMTALKASSDFTKWLPILIMIVGYSTSFYFMLLALKTIPMGITYSIWAGTGVILIAAIGAIKYHEIPDLAAVIGMGLIIVGIVIIRVFSHTSVH